MTPFLCSPSDKPERSRVLIQLPRLLNYRITEYAKIADAFDVAIAYSSEQTDKGFDAKPESFIRNAKYYRLMDKSFIRRLTFQDGLIAAIRNFNPDVVFIQSNVRYLSFWLVLLYCRLRRIPVVGHGQGLYRFQSPGIFRKLLYATHIALSTRYACYTELSRASLSFRLVNQGKLVVTANTVTNKLPVPWEKKLGSERGLLFLGRLRERSGLGDLVTAIESARRQTGEEIVLHLVGAGEKTAELVSMLAGRDWIRTYGAIYEDGKIADISRECFAGVYPGDAGLSVVHYMSLSLPPIVHDSIRRHMGPEPSYVQNGENGFLFSHQSPTAAMADTIVFLIKNPLTLRQMQRAAFDTYEALGRPGLGAALVHLFEEVLSMKDSVLRQEGR